jgi:hypothetical protein
MGAKVRKMVYWHEELPPTDGEMMHEHVLEATSDRVSGLIDRHGELWQQCYDTLMEHTRLRLEQEVKRLGGNYAHVLDEHIDSRRDEATNESWLHGLFSYVLYGLSRRSENAAPTNAPAAKPASNKPPSRRAS